MKNLLIALLLLVSLQSFSNSIDEQVLNMQDEISYCIDIDVGVTVEVQSLKIHSLKVESARSLIQPIMPFAIMENRVELAVNVNVEQSNLYMDKSIIRCFKDTNTNLFNTFVGAGGLYDRQPLST